MPMDPGVANLPFKDVAWLRQRDTPVRRVGGHPRHREGAAPLSPTGVDSGTSRDHVRRPSTAIRRPPDAPPADVIEELLAVVEILPRIEQLNIEAPKILHVAGNESQVMLNGSRSDLRIGCRRATAGTIPVPHESPPDCRCRCVKRQDAPVELPGEILFDPSLKAFATGLFPYLPRASDEFPDGLCRKKEVARGLRLDPVEDCPVRSWPDGLADHIGVQEKGHQARSADRPVEWSRSSVSSASVKGEARKKATNSAPVLALGVVSLGCRDRRISSASSPPERRAPAMALTRGASCKGTVTSTRLAPPVAILLR